MLVVAVAFLLLVVVFAVQNADMVPITFLAWSFSLNQALVVLGAASVGVIIGALWTWVRGIGTRGRIKELSRALESEREKNSALERTISDFMKQKERNEAGDKEVQGKIL